MRQALPTMETMARTSTAERGEGRWVARKLERPGIEVHWAVNLPSLTAGACYCIISFVTAERTIGGSLVRGAVYRSTDGPLSRLIRRNCKVLQSNSRISGRCWLTGYKFGQRERTQAEVHQPDSHLLSSLVSFLAVAYHPLCTETLTSPLLGQV